MHEGVHLRKRYRKTTFVFRLLFMSGAPRSIEEQSIDVAEALDQSGHAIVDGLLGKALSLEVHREVKSLYEAKYFRDALIGKNQTLTHNNDIRSDEICWLAGGVFGASRGDTSRGEFVPPNHSALATFGQNMEALRVALNHRLFLGVQNFECHLARYAKGAAYQAHLDVHQKSAERVLSFVYYLNPAWKKAHGGELKFYGPDLEVEPLLDRLVVFISAEKLHEVKEARQERLTLTGWMRRA